MRSVALKDSGPQERELFLRIEAMPADQYHFGEREQCAAARFSRLGNRGKNDSAWAKAANMVPRLPFRTIPSFSELRIATGGLNPDGIARICPSHVCCEQK